MRFGVNTRVWTSPTTDDELRWLAVHVAGPGFDWIEVPLENIGDMDHAVGGAIINFEEKSLGAGVGPRRLG